MVTIRRLLIVITLCATASLAVAPAGATGVPTGPPASGGGSSGGGGSAGGSPPPQSSSDGSDGGPVQGTVRSCSLYATSSSFGLSCLSGGSGKAKSVRELAGDTGAPTCWDTRVSDADLRDIYQYEQNPLAPYYVLSCISGLNLNAPLSSQPGLNLSQKLVEIPVEAKPCTSKKVADFTVFSPEQMQGTDTTCVMQLVHPQELIAGFFNNKTAQIPGIVIATYPSTRVRTNLDTAFVDRADCAGCVSPTRTANKTAGGVTLYAQMDSFKIEPYGPAGPDQQTCDGAANVKPSDTRATKPNACWYTYTHSSGDQPGETYPFRAEATWSVRIVGQAAPFATFHKYTDIKLPVLDVQTLVIPQAN